MAATSPDEEARWCDVGGVGRIATPVGPLGAVVVGGPVECVTGGAVVAVVPFGDAGPVVVGDRWRSGVETVGVLTPVTPAAVVGTTGGTWR
jgi:hypothetical protein